MSKYIVVFGGIVADKKRVGFPPHLVAKKDGKPVLTPAFHALPKEEQARLEAGAAIDLTDSEAKRMDPTGLCLMPYVEWEVEKKATEAAAEVRRKHEGAEKKGGNK